MRVEKSEDERAVAAVVSIVQCENWKPRTATGGASGHGCERPARLRGKYCSDRCASTARSRRYRPAEGCNGIVTVEKYETVKLM